MEYPSVASCRFDSNRINLLTWQKQQKQQQQKISTSSADLPSWSTSICIHNESVDSIIRIAPNNNNSNKRGGSSIQQYSIYFPKWKTEHFHKDLYMIPKTNDVGIILLFEAMSRECLAICISLQPNYIPNETMYQVVLGANGNTTTLMKSNNTNNSTNDNNSNNIKDIKKGHSNKKRNINNNITTTSTQGRVCQEKVWTSYWVSLDLKHHKLYVGVGTIPGERCISVHETTTTTTTDVGKSNNNNDDESNTNDDHVNSNNNDNDMETEQLLQKKYYVGISNSAHYDRQAPVPLKVRNVRLTSLPIDLSDQLNIIKSNQLDMIVVDEMNNNNDNEINNTSSTIEQRQLMDTNLLREYKDECDKARARANKFGIVYKEPTSDSFIPWSHARRLKANPSKGFLTGIDLSDPNETSKIDARKKRFQGGGITTTSSSALTDEQSSTTKVSEQETSVVDNDTTSNDHIIPIEEAWDNEQYVIEHRVDPHRSLWKEKIEMTKNHSEEEEMNDENLAVEEEFVYEKIHMFSIDWAAFKQIRTNDIMAYFSIYGPSYVEWLGDLSCNIHFQDKYSAKRAIENMSTIISSPPPSLTVDDDESLLEQQDNNKFIHTDLGNIGWRLCKTMLMKISNDKYGKRGTKSRILIRYATTNDILYSRPNYWPKPPPGFTIHNILGPGSDNYNNTNNKKNNKKNKNLMSDQKNDDNDNNDTTKSNNSNKKRKNRKRNKSSHDQDDDDNNNNNNSSSLTESIITEPSILTSGLTAKRDGFTVEEMEAERARKRIKVKQD